LATSVSEEGVPVVTYFNERLLALPAACAPGAAAQIILAAVRPWAPQAHQVQVHPELVLDVASSRSYGTNGFTGRGVQSSVKRMDVRGVPPRGRPV
jgi:hypothetical protein